MNGKGSRPRPFKKDIFDRNWDSIIWKHFIPDPNCPECEGRGVVFKVEGYGKYAEEFEVPCPLCKDRI